MKSVIGLLSQLMIFPPAIAHTHCQCLPSCTGTPSFFGQASEFETRTVGLYGWKKSAISSTYMRKKEKNRDDGVRDGGYTKHVFSSVPDNDSEAIETLQNPPTTKNKTRQLPKTANHHLPPLFYIIILDH